MQSFNKQSGFSLVGVMVAAAMMGGLALGLMQFMQSSSKSAKTLEANTEVNLLHSQVQLFLRNPWNCMATFKGLNFGDDNIPLRRGTDSEGTPDAGFTGLTEENNPVRLTAIKIYHPIDETPPAVARINLPAQLPELDGWWAIVEFRYDKYRSENGVSRIFGGTTVNQYALMKFNNFEASAWTTSPEACAARPFHLTGEGKEYELDSGETVWLGPCLNGDPAAAIKECTII